MTNTEMLAAWILFANKAGDGRIIPNEKEVEAILNDKPDRFGEVHALAQAFVEKASSEPDLSASGIVSTTKGFSHMVKKINEKLGNPLSAPAASKFMPKGKLRP